MLSVYCEIWTGSLNKAVCGSYLRVKKIIHMSPQHSNPFLANTDVKAASYTSFFFYHILKVTVLNHLLHWYQQYFSYDWSLTTYKSSSKYLRVFTLNSVSLFRLICTNKRKFWLIIRAYFCYTSGMLRKQKIIKYLLQYYNKLIATNINRASDGLFVFKLSPPLPFPANCVHVSQHKSFCSIS